MEVGLEKQDGAGSLMFDLHGMLGKVESFLWGQRHDLMKLRASHLGKQISPS